MGNFIDYPDSLEPRKYFHEEYDLAQKLGNGSFATVYKCYRKSDHEPFAVKMIPKKSLTNRDFLNLQKEIKILKKRSISHPNIINLIDVFDDGQHVQMVLELCHTNDLLNQSFIDSDKNHLNERKAAQTIHTLAHTLQYLHEHSIVHRDIKLENILVGMDGKIKIADFGLAHYNSKYKNIQTDNDSDDSDSDMESIFNYESILMKTCCGTPQFIAPEVINCDERKRYNYKCDYWSLGVCLYEMLSGYQPFEGDNLVTIYEQILNGKYDFEGEKWSNVSMEAKDLIKKLLTVDPKERYDAYDIFQHPWIKRYVD